VLQGSSAGLSRRRCSVPAMCCLLMDPGCGGCNRGDTAPPVVSRSLLKPLLSASRTVLASGTPSSAGRGATRIAAMKEKKMETMKASAGHYSGKEGEAFDRDLQEQKRQERMMAREAAE